MGILRKLGFQIDWDLDTDPLEEANEETDQLVSSTQRLGGFLEKNKVKMAAGFAALTFAIGGATFAAGDLELQMETVGAISGATSQELQMLEDEAKNLSLQTKFDPVAIAEGQQFLAQAGFDVLQVMEALPSVLDASAGQVKELGLIADITSNVLSGFQLEAGAMTRVTDTMTNVAAQANVDFIQLGESMKFVAPVAAGLGLTIEETATAVGFMGDVGIQGSMAGTALRAALSKLAAPTTQAAGLMEGLGINLLDNQGNMLDLVGITSQFEKGLSGLNGTQRQAILSNIVGTEAVTGFMAVLNRGSDDLAEFTEKASTQGSTSELAATKLDTLNGSIEILKGSLGLAAIEIGEKFAPAIRFAAESITWLVNIFIKMPEPLQTGIALVIGLGTAFLGVATAVGFLLGPITTFTALFASGGALASVLPWIAGTAIPAVTGAFANMATFITATAIPAVVSFTVALATNPLTWIAAGIAGIVLLIKNFDWLKDKAMEIIDIFDNFNLGEKISSGITGSFDKVKESMTGFTQGIRDFLPFSPAKTGPLSDIDQTGSGLINTVSDSISRNKPKLDESIKSNSPGVSATQNGSLLNIQNLVINAGSVTKDNINQVVTQGTDEFRKIFKELLESTIDSSAAAAGVK